MSLFGSDQLSVFIIFFRGSIPRISALSWKVAFLLQHCRILLCRKTLRDITDKVILPDVDFEWAFWWTLLTLFSQSGSWSQLNTSILRPLKHWSSLTLSVLPSIQPDLLLRHNSRFMCRTIYSAQRNSTHSDSVLQRQTFWYPDEELVCYWTISALRMFQLFYFMYFIVFNALYVF